MESKLTLHYGKGINIKALIIKHLLRDKFYVGLRGRWTCFGYKKINEKIPMQETLQSDIRQ